jgi:hypothetical protein
VPDLVNSLRDPDGEVRHFAVYTLKAIDAEAVATAEVSEYATGWT